MRESLMERQLEGESRGKFIEQFFLGEIPRTVYFNALRKEAKARGGREYMPNEFEDFEKWKSILKEFAPREEIVMDIIRKTQPWKSPRNPEHPLANQLYSAVKEKIEPLVSKFTHTDLRYYTTVNSHLDFFQGTDAIFEYYEDTGKDEDELIARVPIDVKTSKDKGPTILNVSPEDADKLEDFLKEKNMDEYQKIVDKYIGEWSDKIAKTIEEARKKKVR